MSNEQDREREELEQLLAAEALSANDFDDAADRALMNKLLADGELAEEFETYQEAAAQLALATQPIQPPASMKDSLFAKLDSFPQQNPVGDERETPAGSGSSAATDAPRGPGATTDVSENETRRTLSAVPELEGQDDDIDEDQRLVSVGGGASSAGNGEDDFGPVETRARGRWFRNSAQAMLAATAAIVVAVGLFIGGGLAFGGFGQDAQPPSADGDVALILAAPDVDSARTEVAGGGTVTVYWSEELGQSAVVAHGMDQLPAENDYELWYIDGEGPAPAGILTMAEGSPAVRVLDGTFAPGMAVGVTVEEKGGSETGLPTTDPIAVVQS